MRVRSRRKSCGGRGKAAWACVRMGTLAPRTSGSVRPRDPSTYPGEGWRQVWPEPASQRAQVEKGAASTVQSHAASGTFSPRDKVLTHRETDCCGPTRTPAQGRNRVPEEGRRHGLCPQGRAEPWRKPTRDTGPQATWA